MAGDPNAEARRAWQANAAFWDERMGEGNDFVNLLVWPAAEPLLALRPGERVLDVACGNGLTSRRMAAAGGHQNEMRAGVKRKSDLTLRVRGRRLASSRPPALRRPG